MKKVDLIANIAERSNQTKTIIAEIVDAYEAAVADALLNGDDITITGVGKLFQKTTNPRTATNPNSGEKINVPAKKVVKFKCSKTIKDTLNN